MEVVPDDFALIEDRLHHYIDQGCDLIFTTGGTGLTPDDVTPEATRVVIDRDAPGFAEAIDQLFVVLEPTLAHVVQTLRGDSSHHGRRY
jgi:molybdopterin adenylyltransferase